MGSLPEVNRQNAGREFNRRYTHLEVFMVSYVAAQKLLFKNALNAPIRRKPYDCDKHVNEQANKGSKKTKGIAKG